MRTAAGVLTLIIWIAGAGWAVQPDEVLTDPNLESRARAISQKLRCPICQGENIDESNAAISRDLRLYVRERLTAGDTDDAVVDAVVARYGEFVLFEPRAQGGNLLLWWAGPLMALMGLLVAARFMWGRSKPEPSPEPLSDAETSRLNALMDEQDSDHSPTK